MKIENIHVENEGYVYCKSNFYSCQDVLASYSNYSFSVGINKLTGDIDSGVWAMSYLISMYKDRTQDFVLFNQPKAIVNTFCISLDDLSKYSCYLDEIYHLFSSKDAVSKLVCRGLKKSNLNCTPNDIKNLFHIDDERFERSLVGVGNERFRAMAAIGFAYNKQVFCFPWLSKKRFNGYHVHMTDVLNILESLKKIVILPVGK